MKKSIILIIFLITIFSGFTQTATNFICSDCKGNKVNLFEQLDTGGVVVLCWVMPCSTCIPASKTTYNVVESFQTNYPNRVFFYLCDDYANTTCSSLNSWASANGIPATTFSSRFSNDTIKMSNFGSTGMPKIIVLGGSDHTFFYNVNGSVNSTDLVTAINNALAAPSGIQANESAKINFNLFPSPVDDRLNLSFSLEKSSEISVDVLNTVGQVVYSHKGSFNQGENKIEINTKAFNNGAYILRLNISNKISTKKFNVLH